uniref:Metallo-beta-lactamase domain-containing protein n=3 Tax=Aegilops tauschii subsp. strangulata TaxID=200361 RepID=A0A453DU11_AEGTS
IKMNDMLFTPGRGSRSPTNAVITPRFELNSSGSISPLVASGLGVRADGPTQAPFHNPNPQARDNNPSESATTLPPAPTSEMGTPSYRLAAAVTAPPGAEAEFLLVRQLPPTPPLGVEEEGEYGRYVDSDLYDLPSAPLRRLADGEPARPGVALAGAEAEGSLDLSRLDVPAALHQILSQLGLTNAMCGEWRLLKHIVEAEFGPDAGVNTVLIITSLESKPEALPGLLLHFLLMLVSRNLPGHQTHRNSSLFVADSCKWMSKEGARELLSDVKPGGTRIGPYVHVGFVKSELSSDCTAGSTLVSQEYPPGITLVPMKSSTLRPFRTTNLVVIQATSGTCASKRSDYFACGDALLIDPGCCSQVHTELADLVNSLPKKLLVLVTHHHNDHVEGLSVVQRCNPDAVLLTHENTMKRIGKGNWSTGYTAVTGGESICIGDQELQVVFAPGHTDGHMGLLHVNTNALIVGDHCVGHGSAILDNRAGGNMKDYFQTTYKFLEMSPHVLIPMHGRINLWPKHMLCGYLKNRKAREASILQSIENGAQTLFDIVSKTYCDVDRKLWIPASFNVRLHVDHLNSQHKLPKDFSLEMFSGSCDEFMSSLQQ